MTYLSGTESIQIQREQVFEKYYAVREHSYSRKEQFVKKQKSAVSES